VRQGVTLWQEEPPGHGPRPGLDGDTRADVCIVGGGFTGLWTAYHLMRAEPARRVVVLEAHRVGFGASGRNGGWCSALFPVSTSALERRHGRDAALAMRSAAIASVHDLGALTAAEGIDCDFVRGGTVVVARGAAAMSMARAQAQEAAAYGVDTVELLDPDALARHVRVQGASGGTFNPDCARLHPGRLVRGLAAVVRRQGVQVAEGTRALEILPGAVRTATGTVRCDHVVRATEGYTAALAGAPRRALAPVYSLVLATPPLPQTVWDRIGLSRGQAFSEHRHLVVYGQRTADNRLVFGGRGAPYHWRSATSDRFDTNPRVHLSLAALAGELFPALAGAPATAGAERLHGIPVEHTWGGPLGIPRDWHPSVGVDARTRIGWAGGYVGDGVALSQLAGATLADLISGRSTSRTALAWVGHRSRGWEPEPLRWLGMNAGMVLARTADAHERRSGRPSPLGPVLARFTGH